MGPEARKELTERLRDYVANNPEGQRLAEDELQILTEAEVSSPMVSKYGEKTWGFLAYYWKAIPRYLDVPRLVQFLEKRQQDWEQERLQAAAAAAAALGSSHQGEQGLLPYHFFMDYVRKGLVCSGHPCPKIIAHNIANLSTTAFARHSIDDSGHWGESTNQSQSLLHDIKDAAQLDWDFYACYTCFKPPCAQMSDSLAKYGRLFEGS
ncbi:hypothetical protein DFQ27_008901 [Actinomortierella ambigua]|uniref:Uncharacterized protein n=1 Tax=Actinomortierella ambigua TaxID=1343610 RepID=A0A9P6PSM2_9FUNG|nr:hypothetical protein DFQ27_008901 [Actinomortierella ambigua]